jgi:hypothetical protein
MQQIATVDDIFEIRGLFQVICGHSSLLSPMLRTMGILKQEKTQFSFAYRRSPSCVLARHYTPVENP